MEARRIASTTPGASRSITARVASGVRSEGAKAGAAGRQHQVTAIDVGPLAKSRLDQLAIVGDDLTG